MIVCPNCNHQNPDGAVQCEACYTPLPATTSCPSCGATVQMDANFCGQCGFNLKTAPALDNLSQTPIPASPGIAPAADLPDFVPPDPAAPMDPWMTVSQSPNLDDREAELAGGSVAVPVPPPMPTEAIAVPEPSRPSVPIASSEPRTQLQTRSARLLHQRTNTLIELPSNLSVIHVGKWNDRVPPDIDVSGFPDSEIVSRIHADIRVEGEAYYIEDVGSSNGTYINNIPLPTGNRHRLRSGDRIALGKGDRVTFLFQMS